MLIEMIISLTDKAAERVLMLTGGVTGGIIEGVRLDIDSAVLLISWSNVIDIAITGAIGAAAGWVIHLALNYVKKLCKNHKKH